MLATLIILGLSVVFFVWGKVRSDIVALCALIALLIFQILTPAEALSGFSNSVVIMMAGLFIVGGAIFQTGLAKMISSRILKLAGKSETRLFLLVMLVTSAIGAFVSNTGTVALMLPIVVSLAAGAGVNSGRLLMPLAFASSMGGMMTLIGTPPNLIIQDTLTAAGYEPLGFFSFLPVGLVCVAVGVLVLLPLTRIFLSDKGKKDDRAVSGKSLSQLVKEYSLADNLFRLKVTALSQVEGKTVVDLDLRNRYGLNLMEVRRGEGSQHRFLKTVTQKLASSDTVFQYGDVLYVSGRVEDVTRFAADYVLEMMDDHSVETAPGSGSAGTMDFYDIGIAEIVLMPSSGIVGRTVKDAGFRDKFNVNVLGIRRKKEYILHDLGREKLHGGDVLLVQGAWSDIGRLSREDADWVVLGQPMEQAAKVTLDYKAPVAGLIMVLMIAVMVFDFIPVEPVTAVLIAAVLMILTGCFRSVEAAYKTDDTDRLFPQCGGGLQDDKLGDGGAVRRYDAYVAGPREDGSVSDDFGCARGRSGLQSLCPDGRYLFYNIPDDHVHKQYGDGRADGAHRPDLRRAGGHQPCAPALRSDRGRQHVLRIAFLHPAQRAGDARRPIYIHGLYQGRTAPPDHHGHRHGLRPAAPLSILTEVKNRGDRA